MKDKFRYFVPAQQSKESTLWLWVMNRNAYYTINVISGNKSGWYVSPFLAPYFDNKKLFKEITEQEAALMI